MTELLTAAQMKAIETAAISSGEVTGLELMERAGRGVVEAVFEEWPELAAAPHRAVVLCGPGNNGGDGFVVARLLKEWGWEVEVFLYGDADKLPPDAKVNYQRWRKIDKVAVLTNDSFRKSLFPPQYYDIFVDALFGTGLKRALDHLWDVQEALADCASDELAKIVSVDIPSGICSDSGKYLWPKCTADYPNYQIEANLVVSFHKEKVGHRLAGGLSGIKKVVVKDIGLKKFDKWRLPTPSEYWPLPEVILCGPCIKSLGKDSRGHKYAHGHALILSGGAGKTGAARLAARGALRIGAGVVTIGVPPSAQMEVAGHITALMLKRVEGGAALADMLQDKRITALCLGPGLGLERARELIPVALAPPRPGPRAGASADEVPAQGRDVRVVLDADALSAYADAPQELFEMLHQNCVLTPHGGEFARLFPDLSERLCEAPLKGPAYSKVDATRDAAKRAGCVVLFKGADTVIAAPDGRCSINSAHYERAAPWLATAGSGDVLAGFIAGLMARGFDPMQAAETAAWLHVECARSFGPGLIAEDLAEELPKVFTDLNL